MKTLTNKWKWFSKTLLQSFLLVTLFANLANAGVWMEQGDAHHLIGQETLGNGSLDRIDGTISNPDFDPDVYCIAIDDPANFSATAVGSPIGNISLWLFDEQYFGVAHDGADDSAFGPNAGYQASLSNTFVQGIGPGTYFLAVTRGGVDALGFLNPDLEMWLDAPTVEQPANGPGSFDYLKGWTFPGYGVGGSYSIQLTGTSFHGTANVPEPCSFVCALSLLVSGSLIRRRR